MAFQLIYTSVRRGLIPGRSGYTVAARHRQIRDRLVSELERISSYTFAKSGSTAIVYAHRKLTVSGTDFYVLSRIVDAGADYTGRTNHLAHHLVCGSDEIAACKVSPAEVMLQFDWRDSYDEEPRYFDDSELVDLASFSARASLPGENWKTVRGEAADAALPLEEAQRSGVIFVTPADDAGWGRESILGLFSESLQLAAADARDPAAAWGYSFTSYLQPADDLSDFKWVACEPEDSLLRKARRRQVLDLANLAPPVPKSKLAQLAETGLVISAPKPSPPPPTAATSTPPVLSQKLKPPSERPSEKLQTETEIPTPTPTQTPTLLVRAESSFETHEPPRTERPEKLSAFRDRRVVIPTMIAVCIGSILILHLTRSVMPWSRLKTETEHALKFNDYATANRLLDQAAKKRPAWSQRIARYRESEILTVLVKEADMAVSDLRDAPDISLAKHRLSKARAGVATLDKYALAYPNIQLEAEIADFERRIERLERTWEQRALTGKKPDRPEVVTNHNDNEKPRVEPKEDPNPKETIDPEVPAVPRIVYVALNRDLAGIAIPTSLPDLARGPTGKKMVRLEREVLSAGASPWEIEQGAGRQDEYKFPETAAEDDGGAILPIGNKLDAQLRFQGTSQLEIQPSSTGAGARGKVWGAADNCLLRFAGAEDRFWILLWNGSPLVLDARSSLELRGLSVGPTETLRKYLSALTPPAAAKEFPMTIAMRFEPLSAADQAMLSATLDLPIENPVALAIDFAEFSTKRRASIAKLELEIEKREAVIGKAKDYLDWKDRCDQFDEALRRLVNRALGENHEILIRYPNFLDRRTSVLRRSVTKNFCADFLREYWHHLKAAGVSLSDLQTIDAELSQDEFWDLWKNGKIDDADPEEFAEFMEGFSQRARTLSTKKKPPVYEKDRPVRYPYVIAGRTARAELETMADAWDKTFSEEAGEEIWTFITDPRPRVPREVESIARIRREFVEMSATLSKMSSESAAMEALEEGLAPPGTYQFEFVMKGGETLPFVTIIMPKP